MQNKDRTILRTYFNSTEISKFAHLSHSHSATILLVKLKAASPINES